MDYNAYIDAFQEELNRKQAGFGSPRAAGGSSSGNKGHDESQLTEEKKQAMQVTLKLLLNELKFALKDVNSTDGLKDLHEGDNVKSPKAMSQDERFDVIFGELTNIAETANSEVTQELNALFINSKFYCTKSSS